MRSGGRTTGSNGGAKSNIKVGILGAGNVVKELHLPVLRNMPDVEVSWLCDQVERQARNLQKTLSPTSQVFTRIENCPDVDIVLVAIPVGFRRQPLRHIFARGWNVLCEKPFAISLAEHDSIVKEAAESGVHIGVGLVRRYYGASQLARRLIKSGFLGEVIEVWASQGARLTRTDRKDWYQGDSAAAGGGILMETGSHLVDQVFDVLDVSDFTLRDCKQRMVDGLDLETTASASLTTSIQTQIGFNLALSNLRDLYNGIAFRFSKGMLKLGVSTDKPTLCTPNGEVLAHLETDGGAERIYQAFYLEWRDFIRQCLGSDSYKAAISADGTRCSTAFIDQCYQINRSADQPVLIEAEVL
ncbi:MAG TPA: Gfo/Idh/MocA family oxidoreductase [Pyrinomonadaceae bacterium]|nr:Gfo/Idh/MocA family oxidoreductase [Pyrinomonadaceae bacterium]